MNDKRPTPLWFRQASKSILVGASSALILDALLFVYLFRERSEVDRTVTINVETVDVTSIEPLSEENPPTNAYAGEFSWSFLNPPELQFSCVIGSDFSEDYWGKRLNDASNEFDVRLKAAQALWRGRSRRYASDVMKFASKPSPGGEAFQTLAGDVDVAFGPNAILFELREGDYLWGTWLAFLRPHKDFVPVLVANLKLKQRMLAETMLALGNSGDLRALEPLLELLGSKDYQIAGDAAEALGYLGMLEAEPKLIEALAVDNIWRQVNAAKALARMGTARALPALEIVANDKRFTGTLSVRSMAEFAVKSIKNRATR